MLMKVLKIAETIGELGGPNQQGENGFGVNLDKNNPNDGENIQSFEKGQNRPLGKVRYKRIKAPNNPSSHMVAYEDFLAEADSLKTDIETLVKEHGNEKIDMDVDRQFKKFPRVPQ
jgi:hypothetical protein